MGKIQNVETYKQDRSAQKTFYAEILNRDGGLCEILENDSLDELKQKVEFELKLLPGFNLNFYHARFFEVENAMDIARRDFRDLSLDVRKLAYALATCALHCESLAGHETLNPDLCHHVADRAFKVAHKLDDTLGISNPDHSQHYPRKNFLEEEG